MFAGRACSKRLASISKVFPWSTLLLDSRVRGLGGVKEYTGSVARRWKTMLDGSPELDMFSAIAFASDEQRIGLISRRNVLGI